MSRSKLRLLVVMAAVAACGSLIPAAANAATDTPYGVNMVKNHSAEAGPASHGGVVSGIPHWKTSSHGTVVEYGSPDFPTQAEALRIHGGSKFFSCGPHTAQTITYQSMRVSGHRAEIEGGLISVTIKARIATFGTSGDYGQLRIGFDAGSGVVDYHYGQQVTATNGVFRKVSMTRVVPSYARRFEVGLVGVRTEGTYCDAYFDRVSVSIQFTP